MINFIKGNVQVGQLDMERRALLAATRQLKQANTPSLWHNWLDVHRTWQLLICRCTQKSNYLTLRNSFSSSFKKKLFKRAKSKNEKEHQSILSGARRKKQILFKAGYTLHLFILLHPRRTVILSALYIFNKVTSIVKETMNNRSIF